MQGVLSVRESTTTPELDMLSTENKNDYSAERLSEMYFEYLRGAGGVAKKTYENRVYMLNRALSELGDPDIGLVMLYEIDDFLFALSEKSKTSTVNQYKQVLRLFFEYCQARRNVPLQFDYTMIKMAKVKPARVKTFSRDEIAKVLESCKHEIDVLMIATLYETGLRIGELADMKVEDIRGTEIQVRGKGERDRVVMMPPDLAASLRKHLVSRRISRGHVFQPVQHHSNHANDHFGTAGMRDRIQRAFALSGVAMHPHQLRHSFAYNWLTANGDIRTLQKLLGHESLETTQRYLNLTDSHLSEDYSRRVPVSVLTLLGA